MFAAPLLDLTYKALLNCKTLQPWHVDTCDLVALLCLKKARSGGRRWVGGAALAV